MLRYARWLRYRDQVLGHVGALLLTYPRGRSISADHPGLRASIRVLFDSGVPPAAAAAQLAAAVITGFIRQLDTGARHAALERLRRLDDEMLRSMASRVLDGTLKLPDSPPTLAAELAAMAMFLARQMAEEGTLSQRDYEALSSEIVDMLYVDTLPAAEAAGGSIFRLP